MRMQNSIDVIIPTYHPDQVTKTLIKRLLKQTVVPEHIFIMNTEEDYWDKSIELLSDRIAVTHIKKKDFDHGNTRHTAISKSTANYVLCMTQDAMPKDSFLIEQLLMSFTNPLIRAAYARQLPAKNCHIIERCTRTFNYPDKSFVKSQTDLQKMGIKTYFCSNVCAVYDRATYQELGGFVRHTIFNEDMIYAAGLINAGYQIAYAAGAQVIHSHNYSGRQQFHRNFDLAVSQADHPEIFADVPSETEGVKMVRRTAMFLLKHYPWLLVKFIWQSGMKYLGYRFGKNYQKLPNAMVLRMTDNKAYWEK